MFKFFIILLLSISAFTFASDDIDIETDIKIEKILYKNGKIGAEKRYENNVLEGISKSYYPNGKLFQVANYKNGKREGEFLQYYENGKLLSLIHISYIQQIQPMFLTFLNLIFYP